MSKHETEDEIRAEIRRFPGTMLAVELREHLEDHPSGPLAGLLLGLAITRKSPKTSDAILELIVGSARMAEVEELADAIILDWAKWTKFANAAATEDTVDALYRLMQSLRGLKEDA